MFFLLFEKNNKKDVTINSSITNITSTFGFVIIVFIIDWAFICSKLLNSLINIKCRLTEKYAVTPILNIKAITNKMNLFILFSYLFNSIIEITLSC